MRIAIYGAGAIGSYVGSRLASSGAEVSLIARGAHLAALRRHGLTLLSEGRQEVVRLACSDDPRSLGPQDAVILTLKAHSLAAATERLQPLLGPETTVVTAQNGISWWYFYRHGGRFDGRRLHSLDPDGTLWRQIPPERCIGCVLYPAAEIIEPGVVRHSFGNRFLLGEPDGRDSRRCRRLAETFAAAGLEVTITPKIRSEIWLKLWGNLSFNPVSALTGGTLAAIAADPGTRRVVAGMMTEAQAVAARLGIAFPIDVDTRIGWAAAVGEHKTSMLQDLERGRPLEIDALLTVVAEMGAMTGVKTPLLDAVGALVAQRARLSGSRTR